MQRFAIKTTLACVEKFLPSAKERAAKTGGRVRFIGHQANALMLDSVVRRAELESADHFHNVESFGNMKYSLLDTMMAVNIKGPLIVSQAFYPNVKASRQKKLIAISSSNGTLTGEKQPRAGTIFYRMTKAALNREFQIVAASVKKDGVTVIMFNPGPTLTEHQEYLDGKFEGMLKTSFTVENMIKTTEKVTLEDSGKFLRYDGATEPW